MGVGLVIGKPLPGRPVPGPAARLVGLGQRDQVIDVEFARHLGGPPVEHRIPAPVGESFGRQDLAAGVAAVAVKIAPVRPVAAVVIGIALGQDVELVEQRGGPRRDRNRGRGRGRQRRFGRRHAADGNPVARPESHAFEPAAVYLEHVPVGLPGGDRLEALGLTLQDRQDHPVGVQEGDVEPDVGVAHPEPAAGFAGVFEQHPLALAEGAAEHQAARPQRGRIGDLDAQFGSAAAVAANFHLPNREFARRRHIGTARARRGCRGLFRRRVRAFRQPRAGGIGSGRGGRRGCYRLNGWPGPGLFGLRARAGGRNGRAAARRRRIAAGCQQAANKQQEQDRGREPVPPGARGPDVDPGGRITQQLRSWPGCGAGRRRSRDGRRCDRPAAGAAGCSRSD